MKIVKLSAAVMVASSMVLVSSGAQANDVSAYLQQVRVQPKQKKLQATLVPTTAADLDANMRSAINEMSGEKVLPLTKVSRYKVAIDIDAGAVIDSVVNIPLMARIRKGAEITYVQQFATPQEAANAERLCPVGVPMFCEARSLPTNSTTARMLKRNELVSINFEKALIPGVELGHIFSGEMGLGLRSGLLLRGEFEAQIMKIDANNVRLRILVSKGKGRQDRLKVQAPIEIFSLSTLGGVGIKPYAQILREKLKGSMTVSDLVFNLDTAQGAAAFDSVLSQAFSLKDALMPTPFFATDLGPIYKLAKADQGKSPGQRRITLVSTMQSSFDSRTKKRDLGIKAEVLGVGIRLISKKRETHNNQITTQVVDANGNVTNANLSSSSKASGNLQVLFGLIGSKETKVGSTAVLAMLDQNNQPTGEINFIVSQDLLDSKFKASEQKHMILLLQNRMSYNFAQRLNIAQRLDSREVRNAVISTRVIFSNKALNQISGKSAAQLTDAIKAYASGSQEWINNRSKDITEMAKLLELGLSRGASLKARTEALTDLRDNKAFRDIGTGFMMWMMNPAEVESTVAVKLYMQASGRNPTELQIGTITNPEALAALQLVDEELNAYRNVPAMATLNATILQ